MNARVRGVRLLVIMALPAAASLWVMHMRPAAAGTEKVPVAFVTDLGTGYLDEVNLDTGGILAQVSIPDASALAVNAAGTDAYVAGGNDQGQIYPVDLTTMTVGQPMTVICGASDLVFDPTGTTLWVVSANVPVSNVSCANGIGGLTPIDMSSNPPVPGQAIDFPKDAEPISAVFDQTGATLYVGESSVFGGIVPVDVSSGTLGTTISTGVGVNHMSVAAGSDTAYALLANEDLQAIDMANNTAASAFSVGAKGDAPGLTISPSGTTAYVADNFDNMVIPVDLTNKSATGQPISVQDPSQGVLNSTGTTLYEAAGTFGNSPEVAVIDTTSDTLIKAIPLPPSVPYAIALGTATITTTTTTTTTLPRPRCGASTGANLGQAAGIAAVDIGGCDGYYVVDSTGKVATFGSARSHGDLTGIHLASPIIAIETTPDGQGYWLLGADGGVFTFGDAHFYGSTADIHLNAPVVGMAVTPTNKGYWVIAKDGGVFSYGDARFHGSTGNIKLTKPVDGIAVAPGGAGYWLVASDGGVFTFTADGFYGSLGGIKLHKPIVGMASTPNGRGYTLVGADGGVFSFGNAPFYGSLGAHPPASPIVDLSPAPANDGYYLVSAIGQVYNFGPGTKYFGSA